MSDAVVSSSNTMKSVSAWLAQRVKRKQLDNRLLELIRSDGSSDDVMRAELELEDADRELVKLEVAIDEQL